uniref:Endonuclease/exonuclease/phosphatase domain-containing protein n=1 Tax=Photinus pyralis TaxID=7054 RepID=A0A1Y1L6G0_PHOPY
MAHELNYDFLCINEHWLKEEEITVLDIENYHVVSSFCRKNKIHGGVCILARNDYSCTSLNLSRFSKEIDFEVAGVKCQELQLVSIYRSPCGNFDIFLEQLVNTLQTMNFSKPTIVTADFNVKFNTKDERAMQLSDLFLTCGLRQTVFVNTRDASCLDNIFTNIDTCSTTVMDTCFSDHKVVGFTFDTTCYKDPISICINSKITYRPITKCRVIPNV